MKLSVKIIPNAKVSEIVNWENNQLKIRIKAPPVEGKANEELIRFLAKHLKIQKSDITIKSGQTSKSKLLEIPDTCLEKLNAL